MRIGRTLLALLGMVATSPAWARPTAASAEAFLRRLYAPYVAGIEADPTLEPTDAIFAPPLLGLLRLERDRSRAYHEVFALDWDPVCDCQDAEGFTRLSVKAHLTSPGRARAVARFHINATSVTVTYRLVAVRGGWRIADIGDKAVPSIAAHISRTFFE